MMRVGRKRGVSVGKRGHKRKRVDFDLVVVLRKQFRIGVDGKLKSCEFQLKGGLLLLLAVKKFNVRIDDAFFPVHNSHHDLANGNV